MTFEVELYEGEHVSEPGAALAAEGGGDGRGRIVTDGMFKRPFSVAGAWGGAYSFYGELLTGGIESGDNFNSKPRRNL